jgi:hypothetical protein
MVYIGAIVLFILISMNKYLTYIGLIAAVVLIGGFTITNSQRKSVVLPELILVLLLFQNFCIGVGAHFGENIDSSIQLLTQVPSLLIFVSFFAIILAQRSEIKPIFIVYALFLVGYFLFGRSHFQTAIVYLRNFVIFYMGFVIGHNNLDTESKRSEFISFLIKLGIIAGIFGLIGLLFGERFFNLIGIKEVYIGKNWSDFNGLPGNFSTIFLGVWINRLASFYYEPVNFSYFIFLASALAFLVNKKIEFIFLLLCSSLTFGKGGALTFIFTLAAVLLHTSFKLNATKRNFTLINLVLIASFVGTVWFISKFQNSAFGTYSHFYGFFSAIPEILKKPLGYGLGSAGNILRSYLNNRVYMATESALGTMGYQIGIVGLLLFFLIIRHMSKCTFMNVQRQNDHINYTLCLFASYLPFVLFLVSAFQENTLSPQVIIPYMLLVGAYAREPDCIEEDLSSTRNADECLAHRVSLRS